MSLDVEESTRRPCEGRRVSSCLWRVCATTEGASPGLQTAAGPDRRHTALPPNRDNLAKIPYAMEATTPHHAAPSDTPVLNIFSLSSRMAMIPYHLLWLLPTWPVCVPGQLWPPVPVLLQSRVLFLGRGRRFVLLTRQRAGADRRARCAQVQTGHSQLSNGGNLARLRQQQQRVVKHGQTRQQRGVRRAFLLRLHASHRSGAELSLSSTNALPATHTTQKQNDESEGQLGSCRRTLGDLSSLNSIVGFTGCTHMYTWQA